jgi:hypothetical protein
MSAGNSLYFNRSERIQPLEDLAALGIPIIAALLWRVAALFDANLDRMQFVDLLHQSHSLIACAALNRIYCAAARMRPAPTLRYAESSFGNAHIHAVAIALRRWRSSSARSLALSSV